MAEISSITLPGGGTYDLKDKNAVPKYGMGKNLLDNWYFLNPVNQRGKSSYTGAVRGIDRWVCRHSTGTVSVTTNGVTLSKGSGTAIDFYQPQEEAFNKQLAGKTVTVSVLLYPNRFVTETGRWQVSASGTIISESDFYVALGGTVTAWTNFYIRASSDITIQAIKLELGSESTLCHNEGTEANPVWVLNETADYEEELIKCQTNTANSGDTYANKSLATEQQIAYVETGATTSRAYSVGEYFCWNGLLYRVKTAISSGDPFTPGTNCEVPPGGGLNGIIARRSSALTGTANGTATNVIYYNDFMVQIHFVSAGITWAKGDSLGIIPADLRPPMEVKAIAATPSGTSVQLSINQSNGGIYTQNDNNVTARLSFNVVYMR